MCISFATAMMIASTAVSAVSQVSQGQQAKRMGEFDAAQHAADARAQREAGIVHAEKTRKDGARHRAAAVAGLAGSGIDVGSGTPIRIEGAIEREVEDAALNEVLTGERRSSRLQQEGELARLAGRNRQTAGYMGAFSSLLSGGAQAAKGWGRARSGVVGITN